ncbi:MAG: hypothetical protein ACUVT5_02475 [Candidatus Bathyarchaeales archaeon]
MDKRLEKIDLLSLPVSERLRVCREIRAVLARRVEEAKVYVDEVCIMTDKNTARSAKHSANEIEKLASVHSNKKASVLNSLLKRIW